MTSISLFNLVLSVVMYFHFFKNGNFYVIVSLIVFLFYLIRWFFDVIEESTFEGNHTEKVKIGIRLGMSLFIVSEVMFFFSFFWAFFHITLAPSVDIACI
jgi:cytochrome c oxidase subunit 3